MGKRENGDNSGIEDTSRENEREADVGESDVTRRGFLEGTGAALVVAGVPKLGIAEVAPATVVSQAEAVPQTTIRVTVNGSRERVEVEDRWTLIELLRGNFGLTGSKIGCNRGECGACTVLVDGEPTYSCSTLAVWMDGRAIETVEGLEQDDELTPLQQAFIDHDAAQCGFCTPGQLMAATALLERNASPNTQEVREALVGNLCRCSNYNAIVEAVLATARTGGAP